MDIETVERASWRLSHRKTPVADCTIVTISKGQTWTDERVARTIGNLYGENPRCQEYTCAMWWKGVSKGSGVRKVED
jgi:hypothetical protein